MLARWQNLSRFQQRTLVVVLTLLILVLGWIGRERKMVKERAVVAKWLGKRYDIPWHDRKKNVVMCWEEYEHISWLREQFGDQPYHWNCLLPDSANDRARIFAAFPLAKTYEWSHDSGNYVELSRR